MVLLFLSSELCFLSRVAAATKTCTEEALYMTSKAADCLEHEDPDAPKLKSTGFWSANPIARRRCS